MTGQFEKLSKASFDRWVMKPFRSLPPRNILGLAAFTILKCVITDVQMPGMTGIDIQDRLIADGYRRPIIFISAAEDAGAHDLSTTSRFLKKPFSDERLIDCLDRALKAPTPNTRKS
jgi:FixJ family two-component response regulator